VQIDPAEEETPEVNGTEKQDEKDRQEEGRLDQRLTRRVRASLAYGRVAGSGLCQERNSRTVVEARDPDGGPTGVLVYHAGQY
jgi:hypothetical protein